MKIAAIADIHGQLPRTLPHDVEAIIIAGDICPDFPEHAETRQYVWLTQEFSEWLNKIPITIPIYMTWGNHDRTQGMSREVEENWRPSTFMVVDDWVPIQDHKVWFSPWCENLPGWAWNLTPHAAPLTYAAIPPEVDIIVSHAPPYGTGDSLRESSAKYGLPPRTHVGSKNLLASMRDLPNLDRVICGHIHESRGDHPLSLGDDRPDISVHNVASVDANYRPVEPRWTLLEI